MRGSLPDALICGLHAHGLRPVGRVGVPWKIAVRRHSHPHVMHPGGRNIQPDAIAADFVGRKQRGHRLADVPAAGPAPAGR